MAQNTNQKNFYSHLFDGLKLVLFFPLIIIALVYFVTTYLPFLVGGRKMDEVIGYGVVIFGNAMVVFFFVWLASYTYKSHIASLAYRPPEKCMRCRKTTKMLNGYHLNAKGHQDEYLFVCSACLLKQISTDLEKAQSRVVFVEPTSEEGYAFTPFNDDTLGLGSDLITYLPESHDHCVVCGQKATTVWLPEEVIDTSYRFRFLPKAEFHDHLYFCNLHLMEKFSSQITKSRVKFWEFWPITRSHDGFFY